MKIPSTLEEAIQELANIDKSSNETDIEFNGMAIRNAWGLWTGSELAFWFYERDIYHADDMSGIIIDSYKRYKKGEPIDLEKQIKVYHNHWKNCYGDDHIKFMRDQASPKYKTIIERNNKIETITNE